MKRGRACRSILEWVERDVKVTSQDNDAILECGESIGEFAEEGDLLRIQSVDIGVTLTEKRPFKEEVSAIYVS